MQGRCKQCLVQETLPETQLILNSPETCLPGFEVDVFGVAELVAGYMDCMEEALRYLKEVEQYSEDHPAVLGLRQHLALYRRHLVDEALQGSTVPEPSSSQ